MKILRYLQNVPKKLNITQDNSKGPLALGPVVKRYKEELYVWSNGWKWGIVKDTKVIV